ncbi:MAG: aminopeptidase, partial [Clostridia bacterium]|nr:aminopeptidase [Clostridia bacterium]
MKKTIMKAYARLIAESGVNVQKGQQVVIIAGLDQPEFVEMVAQNCYRLGASKVRVEWNDPNLMKLDVRYQSLKTLSTLEEPEKAKWLHRKETLPAMIYLESDDPDSLKGIDHGKMTKARRETMKFIKPIRDEMDNRYQWCIAAVPGKTWARKMFPGLSARAAEEKQWEAILSCSRALEGDPVENWIRHNGNLSKKCERLNALGIRELRYRSSIGTDFRVGLLEESVFLAGGERTLSGVYYNPNIPSEEVFTSPRKGDADGWVYASKPLSYNGETIEGFAIRFEKGKAVEWKAEKNESLLSEMLGTDEGASFLGEVALVPVDSPISESGLLFYNTLFDENAACHLALGMGFADTIVGFENKTLDECRALGINDSMMHVDF